MIYLKRNEWLNDIFAGHTVCRPGALRCLWAISWKGWAWGRVLPYIRTKQRRSFGPLYILAALGCVLVLREVHKYSFYSFRPFWHCTQFYNVLPFTSKCTWFSLLPRLLEAMQVYFPPFSGWATLISKVPFLWIMYESPSSKLWPSLNLRITDRYVHSSTKKPFIVNIGL